MDTLRFDDDLLARRAPSGIDVETTLQHFAIITLEVPPEALRPQIHERFELVTISGKDGQPRALVSVVPFLDKDFRFPRFPSPRWHFGQTNYRAYVIDRTTGRHAVWFFGTTLGSWTVAIPRHLWKLPWHSAQFRFDCVFDDDAKRFTKYEVTTKSRWAPAHIRLEDEGTPPEELRGFPDLETGLVVLTHPLDGFFFRRDGTLGSYSIWHDRLHPTQGRLLPSSFPLLERLNLLPEGPDAACHSVLLQKSTEFTIYLPPKRV